MSDGEWKVGGSEGWLIAGWFFCATLRRSTMPTLTLSTIRAPWPDEMPRLRHFLPPAFLASAPLFSRVAVRGRVERIVGAAALNVWEGERGKAGWLFLRAEEKAEPAALVRPMLREALAAGWAAGLRRIYLAGTVEENSPLAAVMTDEGFTIDSVHEVHESSSQTIGPRIARVHGLLVAGGRLPAGIEITTLQPSLGTRAHQFLVEHMPQSASALALQGAAYHPEHSFVLFLAGEIKGVVLCRRTGDLGYIGLRVVAKELRGSSWANVLLLHAYLSSGARSGLTHTRFEFDPELHEDTRQFAVVMEAKLVGRRLLLQIDSPRKTF